MSSAIEHVQQLISSVAAPMKLEKLTVDTDMYKELEVECAPQTPSEFFGIPISIDPKLDDPDYLEGRRLH